MNPMPAREIIFYLALLALLAAAAWHFFRANPPPAPLPEARYESAAYRFSFEYPEELSAYEYFPESVAVGTENEAGGFDSVADATVAFTDGEGEGYERYEDFVLDRARAFCAADGPGVSIECDEAVTAEPFTADSGAIGTKLMLRLLTRSIHEGTTATSTFGPVYAFPLATSSSASEYAALIIHRPLPVVLAGLGADVADEMALSLTLARPSED